MKAGYHVFFNVVIMRVRSLISHMAGYKIGTNIRAVKSKALSEFMNMSPSMNIVLVTMMLRKVTYRYINILD